MIQLKSVHVTKLILYFCST